ncbi:VIR protein [Plasmodium vivax]|uniref:VIR protein n=1 Tax=Plasmodium vivax TaxID=5855 RepID=A0A1G4EBT2_PLAVI|nr:VIR protein [Plasmodium vivax]
MEPPVGDEEYNLDEIFPTYKLDYESVTKNFDSGYIGDCSIISQKFHNDEENKFVNPCLKFIHYLKYIKKNLSIVDKKKSCKYFNYMLMYELQKIDNSFERTNECYNTMINEYSNKTHGIDICKGNIEEFNKVIFDKFQKIDSLYDIFYKFTSTQEEGGSEKCDLGKKCSEQYYTLINICDQNSNIGFCMALDKFRDSYNFHMKNESECDKIPRYLYSPFGTERRRTFSISLITMFAMSTILFIVYKFTPVYSWLHSILRKKSKIRNDLYEESRNLKNNDNIKKNNSKNSPLNIQYHSSENS